MMLKAIRWAHTECSWRRGHQSLSPGAMQHLGVKKRIMKENQERGWGRRETRRVWCPVKKVFQEWRCDQLSNASERSSKIPSSSLKENHFLSSISPQWLVCTFLIVISNCQLLLSSLLLQSFLKVRDHVFFPSKHPLSSLLNVWINESCRIL